MSLIAMLPSRYRPAWLALLLLYGALIAWLSLKPGDGPGIGPWDKLAHALAYAGFAVIALGVEQQWRRYLLLCLGIAAYGVALEFAQFLMPGRHMSLLDALANSVGIAAVAGFAWLRLRPAVAG